MRTLKDVPEIDRPREKIFKHGPGSLTDVELVAAILGNGSKSQSVLSLSKKVLDLINHKGLNLQQEDLIQLKGLGYAKVSTLLAAIEFSKRRLTYQGMKIQKASDILPLLEHLKYQKQEVFTCFSLNGAMEIISQKVVTIGLVNKTLVHPREVFSTPIIEHASSIIVAHNHPSGNCEPSEQDKRITLKLIEAGKLLGIQLLDHVIFSKSNYFSMMESGLILGVDGIENLE